MYTQEIGEIRAYCRAYWHQEWNSEGECNDFLQSASLESPNYSGQYFSPVNLLFSVYSDSEITSFLPPTSTMKACDDVDYDDDDNVDLGVQIAGVVLLICLLAKLNEERLKMIMLAVVNLILAAFNFVATIVTRPCRQVSQASSRQASSRGSPRVDRQLLECPNSVNARLRNMLARFTPTDNRGGAAQLGQTVAQRVAAPPMPPMPPMPLAQQTAAVARLDANPLGEWSFSSFDSNESSVQEHVYANVTPAEPHYIKPNMTQQPQQPQQPQPQPKRQAPSPPPLRAKEEEEQVVEAEVYVEGTEKFVAQKETIQEEIIDNANQVELKDEKDLTGLLLYPIHQVNDVFS